MPMYPYRFLDTGEEFEEFAHMNDPPLIEKNGRKVERAVCVSRVRTNYGEGSGTEPIEMMSIGVDTEEEIAAFRARNPGVEISDNRHDRNFGIPIAKSRTEKLRILKNEGFVETN